MESRAQSGEPLPAGAGVKKGDTGRLLLRIGALAVAFLFLAHGVAHAVGFSGAWGLSDAETPDGYTLVGGLGEGSAALKAVALIWLAGLALYVAAAIGLAFRRTWWRKTAFIAVGVSEVACILWLEPAIVGTVLNVVILVGLIVSVLVDRSRSGSA